MLNYILFTFTILNAQKNLHWAKCEFNKNQGNISLNLNYECKMFFAKYIIIVTHYNMYYNVQK